MGTKKVEAIRAKVKELVTDVSIIEAWIRDLQLVSQVRSGYQGWYVAALRLVKEILDEEEVRRFVDAYKRFDTQQYLTSESPLNYADKFAPMLALQKGLVAAIPDVSEAKALDLRILVVGDVLGDEMEIARSLLEQNLIRAAGVIGGVVLEGHLKLLHDQNSLEYPEAAGIGRLAEGLGKESVLTPGQVKRVRDIMAPTRNKCAHKGEEEPTFQEVEDFLDDVERFAKRTGIA